MEDRTSTVLVGKPGRLRDGLRALMRSISNLEILGEADDEQMALRMVENFRPALVLLDTNVTNGNVPEVVERIKIASPQVRVVVLTSSYSQKRAIESANADAVLLKGYSARALLEVLETKTARNEP